MDENVANFVAITSCDADKAGQYLRLTDNNFEQAIQLYFDSPNLDFGPAPTSNAPPSNATSSAQNPINIESDEDMSDFDPAAHASTPRTRALPDIEDDEAMARRLQEEMYGGGGPAGAVPGHVRAPMQRTTETLIGPDSNWGAPDDDEMNAMVQEQLARRRAGMFHPLATFVHVVLT